MIKPSQFHLGITLVFAGLGSEPTEIESDSPCGRTLEPRWAGELFVEELDEKNQPLPLPNHGSVPLRWFECKVTSHAHGLERVVSSWW